MLAGSFIWCSVQPQPRRQSRADPPRQAAPALPPNTQYANLTAPSFTAQQYSRHQNWWDFLLMIMTCWNNYLSCASHFFRAFCSTDCPKKITIRLFCINNFQNLWINLSMLKEYDTINSYLHFAKNPIWFGLLITLLVVLFPYFYISGYCLACVYLVMYWFRWFLLCKYKNKT